MRLCDSDKCTGCMACEVICPVQAIASITDDEGFTRPVFIETRCTYCGKCTRTCPILNNVPRGKEFDRQVFSGWARDEHIRRFSSSGGAFSVLAINVLDRGGVVFGAALDEKQVVRHIAINNREDLARLRGSKYVQSNIGESYIGVRNFLEEGRWVLFSGTPCQIAGLLNVLGGDHARLITVDLVCHGVPSPMVFESYKTYMTHRFNMNIHSISFRDKKYSWIYMNMLIKGLKKKNGTEYVYEGSCLLDPYWLGFMRDLFHRPSCYQCLFAKQERVSDITLADWWHYKSNRTVEEKGCFEKGVSLILTNTLKGKVLFAEVKEELVVRQRELDEAFQTNMCFNTSFIRPQLRDAFWCDYHRLPFNEVVNKYLRPAKIGVALKLRALHRQTFGIKGLRFALRVFAWGIRKAGIVRSTITQ